MTSPSRIARWLLLPALALLALAYVLPMAEVVRIGLNEPSRIGVTDGTFSLQPLVQAVADPFYWGVIVRTAVMGLATALLTTVIAYPIALLITVAGPRVRGLLLLLAIAPMLTSSVARSFGWVVMLSNQGLVNTVLTELGMERPLQMIGTMGAIVVALAEIFLPYAVLGMVSGFGRISPTLEDAARTLGARPLAVFRKVTLPLSMPGVIVSLILVFVLSISSYVTPRILGGGQVFVLGTEIFDEAKVTLNWPLAASLSLVLLVLFAAFTGVSALIRRRSLYSGEAR
jgi:putative spermidine/putrescine transport system permease protein